LKARILPLETAEHSHVELMLPWYVNETLDTPEREQVEAHIGHCERCQADVAFQTRLRGLSGMLPVPNDVALGWNAIRGRIGQKTAAAAHKVNASHRLRWWQLAWGIQGTLNVGLAIALAAVALRPEPYRTLGTGPSTAAANALVVFKPTTTEAQIRAALRAGDARLVGGPTVTDFYLVQIASPDPGALKRLRAQPGVSQVESLVGGSAPPPPTTP
jgi:anti-sigma factor RsiW